VLSNTPAWSSRPTPRLHDALPILPNGGLLEFNLSRFSLKPGDSKPVPNMAPGNWIRIDVSDNGTGIPEEVMPHIYDPFFTTKPRSEEHTSELQSRENLVCRLLLEK